MGWFFTKAALLTFGRAHAVLPYVYQGAVGHYGWLTPTQMIDGLALGETTPRPLIVVVAFVGFVGGYVHPMFGAGPLCCRRDSSEHGYLVHVPAILPLHPGWGPWWSPPNELKYTAPLTGITAGTVDLALSFGYHMLWPNGFEDAFDWSSALIAVGAAVALFRFKRGVTRYCTPLHWPDLLSKPLNNAERPACFGEKRSSASTTCRF